MERLPSLVIAQDDFHKILSLLPLAKIDLAELLEEELRRATLVPTGLLPRNVVGMNSVVSFVDVDTGKHQRVTLVYPHDADIEDGRISILAPVGAALIGLRVGQEIEWPLGDGKTRRLRILAVTQPEMARA